MKFDFEEPIPIVQEKKKYANFKITPIGGPEEIVKWREMQAAKESLYRLRLSDRDSRLDTFEKETGQKLDTPTIHTTSWHEKLAFAASERERLAKLEEAVIQYPPWEMTPKPKQSFGQKIIGFFKRIWSSSNF